MTASVGRTLELGYEHAMTRLPDRAALALRPRSQRFDLADVPPPVRPPADPIRLYIAPVNFAGQGYAWARAAERLAGVGAVAMQYRNDRDLGFVSDCSVPHTVFARSGDWARRQREAVAAGFSHVLIEAARPIFGSAFRGVRREVEWLRRRGVTVGMIAHGTDLRLPSRHGRLDEWSPFRDPSRPWVTALERKVRGIHAVLAEIDAPVFVSTPEMLLDWPSAVWLPLAIEPTRWHTTSPPLERDRPVVLHAPTNPRVKGTALIEPVVERLEDEGLISYQRVVKVPSARMPGLYAQSDIVLEQFALGIYSTTAVEAMAAGRVVIGHVHEQVRAHVRDVTGLDVPVLEATPATLEAVLRDVVADRVRYRRLAAQGPAFVAAVHDGAWSARALAPFLGASVVDHALQDMT